MTGADLGERNWRRIKATVKPLEGGAGSQEVQAVPLPSPSAKGLGVGPVKQTPRQPAAPTPTSPLKGRGLSKTTAAPGTATTLDGSWDRNIRTGRLEVDMTVDLHGHSVASAHATLARALDRATAHGVRVILLIAGKSRGPDEAPRGAIRRELETWLAHSRHASRIASVRNAHPRHGGAGAVYVVLRKLS